MKNIKNKTKVSIIALITILTISAIIIVLPAAYAQETELRKKTYPYIGIIPDPAGVNQQILLHVGITDNLGGPIYGWEGLSVTIEKPDGTTETLTNIRTDSTGGTGVPYTPTMVGTYFFQTHFPEQLNPANSRVGPAGMVMEASDSEKYELVVQEEQVPYYPGHSLPTEYWTRPIDAQLREWYTVAGHWLYVPRNKYAPNNNGPETSHVLWTKPIEIGGVVGGELGTSDLEALGYHGMECGDAYEGKWGGRVRGWGTAGPIILAGRIYYREGAYDLPRVYHCVDLRTGEEYWSKTFLDNQSIAFGQLFYWDSYNYHGVYPYLWVTTGGRGQPVVWHAFAAYTGEWMFTVENVPSGTTRWGPKGEIYRFQVDLNNGWMALWNMSALGSMEGSWGRFVHLNTLDAAANTSAASRAWSWNKTIPTNLEGSVREIYFGDRIIGGTASTSEVTSWAISLKPGQEGTQIFSKTWSAPSEWEAGNVSISWEVNSPNGKDGVFVIYARQLRKYYGFSMNTGENLWETDPEHYLNTWVGTECTIVYDKFISTGVSGITHCYDALTGVLLWDYEAVDPYQEVLWANNWWTKPMIITDGKIYIAHMEHSAIDPKPRGAPFICLDVETGDEIWRANGLFRQTYWGSNAIIGDSVIATMDVYDQRVYAIGKGPSKITATASPESSLLGRSVLIKGMVTDESPGTKEPAIQMRFPNGVPAVSDASMSDWMLYVYKQFERPYTATGVEVKLEVVMDPNGNWYDIGTTTTDSSGFYSIDWEPPVPGHYLILASFAGSEAYYGSYVETAIVVDEAPTPAIPIEPEEPVEPETPEEPEAPEEPEEPEAPEEPEEPEAPEQPEEPTEPEQPATEAPFISTEIAIIATVAVIAVVGLAAFWILRRK